MTAGIDTTLDHTALLLYRNDGTGYFYSFAADASDFLAAIAGTDGYYSTAVSHNGSVANDGIKSRVLMSYGFLYQYGKVYTDWIDDRNGSYDVGYYRMIRIPISDTVGQSLAAYAQLFRNLCKQYADDGTSGYGTSNGITSEYSLLDHNCYDVATQILGLLGYEVIYSNVGAYARLAAVCAVLTAANMVAGTVLANYIAIRELTGTIPSVPNCAYTELDRVERNGSVVCYATDAGVKDEFRSRGAS